MKQLILLFALIYCILTLNTRSQTHLKKSQFHFLNGQACKKQGGYICGFVDKDCCKLGCKSQAFGLYEECKDGQQLKLSQVDCKQLCQKQSGVMFKNYLLDDNLCCQKNMFLNDKCPENGLIDISTCTKGTLADKIVGIISGH